MSVLVSINCITYNHEEYIADAIEGFLMQKTDFNYEILIGEDCSTDNTREVVKEYVKRFPDKIRLITSNQNVGPEKNDKRIFENSKGKYIAICEGDDYWIDPYKLQKQVDYLERNPDCTLCFHAADIVQAPLKRTGRKVRPYRGDRISLMKDFITGGGGFCPTASLVYPRRLMENPPSFFRAGHVGDYLIQLILASRGYAYYIDECMSIYRKGVKGSWMSRQSSGNIKEKMIESNEGDIEILVGFNKYTDFKYSEYVEKTIRKKEFEVLVLQRKIREQRSRRYKNLIEEMNFTNRLKFYSRCYFPKSYTLLARIKANI